MSQLLQPGRTCWRIETAERFAVIVDGADYYRALKEAILKARRSVAMIGWDFDTRVAIEPEGATLDGPNELGEFLEWTVERDPELDVSILKWNLGIVNTLSRGETPLYVLRWMSGASRVRLKLDAAHPVAASHHQKIVVIDDALAFCGGIDITMGRWDTRAHRDVEPKRRAPGRRGALLQPWHDATTCVDGPAARALGDLARERWHRATGKAPESPPSPPGDERLEDLWPDSVAPLARSVPVAVSRTAGAFGDFAQVSEIEALTLAMIAGAKRAIFVENQYFASRRIAEAMAARLAEPDGPEILMINPQSQEGWLEEATMGAARVKLLAMMRRADRFDRFRLFHPVTAGGVAIYVHAKIMIVDDRVLKIGSANFNNRSMGFDTECDLSVDAALVSDRASVAALAAAIAGVRDDLLAEHLGLAPDAVSAAIAEHGSMVRAVDRFARETRRLQPLQARDLDAIDQALAEADLVDPERPPRPLKALARRLSAIMRLRAEPRPALASRPDPVPESPGGGA